MAGDVGQARLAWEAAGECWRRADRPVDAVGAFEKALALDPEATAPVVRARIAGSAADVGRFDLARSLCRTALERAPRGPVRAVVLDTLCGVELAMGDPDQAEHVAETLRAEAEGPIAVAATFRIAQVRQVRGLLDEAEAGMRAALALVEGTPGLAGLAAARTELGNIASLRDDLPTALMHYRDAIAAAQEAGRSGLAWHAEAGRVRVQAALGLTPLVARLDPGLALAVERGMAPLRAELLLSRGTATGVAADLDLAAEIAARCGMRWTEGRALFARAQGTGDATAAARAVDLLAEHAIWQKRVRALAPGEPHDTV